MIINADAKGLEIYCGAYLSQDTIMMNELISGVDLHSANQAAFDLPSRLIAKVFKFRLMYGGSAYSYANDPDFASIGGSEKYWQRVIDKYYDKYKGFANWHTKIVQEVIATGQLTMPTGRVYRYAKTPRGEWPITTIKNYPVQGLGADLMSIIRVSFAKRFHKEEVKGLLVNTIHDSIVVDCEDRELPKVVKIFHSVFRDAPANFKKVFGVEFNLPLLCEVSYGNNMKELTEIS